MRFWDASALVPLLVQEIASPVVDAIYQADPSITVWWSARVECRSSIERRAREGSITVGRGAMARTMLVQLFATAQEIDPDLAIRYGAERLLASYPLRAADALQLAAALAWADGQPAGRGFVCLDQRLRAAAQAEGFALLPSIL